MQPANLSEKLSVNLEQRLAELIKKVFTDSATQEKFLGWIEATKTYFEGLSTT